jgi:hypothetical protein
LKRLQASELSGLCGIGTEVPRRGKVGNESIGGVDQGRREIMAAIVARVPGAMLDGKNLPLASRWLVRFTLSPAWAPHAL